MVQQVRTSAEEQGAPLDIDATAAPSVRSILRAAQILDAFNSTARERTVPELAELTNLPRTTVVRIVATLLEVGLVAPRPDGRYCLGPHVLPWALAVSHAWLPPASVESTLQNLASVCGETVSVYVRAGDSRICVARYYAAGPIRHVVQVGDRVPLWGGAAAHIMLEDASESELQDIAAKSPYGIKYASTLRDRIQAAKSAGYAISLAERNDGVAAVAVVANWSGSGRSFVVSVSGPTAHYDDQTIRKIVSNLAKATAESQDSHAH